LVLGNVDSDLAMLTIDRSEDDPDFVKFCQPLPVVPQVTEIRIGEPIAAMGFPYGELLHIDARLDPNTIARLGPILQHGYVSGVQPWEGLRSLNDLFLDLRSIGGMSGAPVFRGESGVVIGVIYAGMNAPVEGTPIFVHASVIAKAVPLDAVRLSGLLRMVDGGQYGLIQGTVSY
jgi:hypothetical protein